MRIYTHRSRRFASVSVAFNTEIVLIERKPCVLFILGCEFLLKAVGLIVFCQASFVIRT
jgi:hypothetical protein